MVHTERKFKRKRKGRGTLVVESASSSDDNYVTIRQSLSGINRGGRLGRESFLPPDRPCVMILNLRIISGAP